jgi:hypothetical protein
MKTFWSCTKPVATTSTATGFPVVAVTSPGIWNGFPVGWVIAVVAHVAPAVASSNPPARTATRLRRETFGRRIALLGEHTRR